MWRWLHNDVELDDGKEVTADHVRTVLDEEVGKIKAAVGQVTVEKDRRQESSARCRPTS